MPNNLGVRLASYKTLSKMSEYELIDHIRMRTGLYTVYQSPTHLHSFLSGYFYAKQHEEFKEGIPSFHGFHDWVAGKLGYKEATSGWAYMIEDQREDTEEALYLFYELLNEYRGIKHLEIASVEFKHESATDKNFYRRLKKVRGTFKAMPKPLPKCIIVREVKLGESWFELVAKNEKGEVLFVRHAVEREEIYQRAKELFGIEKHEWKMDS